MTVVITLPWIPTMPRSSPPSGLLGGEGPPPLAVRKVQN